MECCLAKERLVGNIEYDSLPGLPGQIRMGCIRTAKLGSQSCEDHHQEKKRKKEKSERIRQGWYKLKAET